MSFLLQLVAFALFKGFSSDLWFYSRPLCFFFVHHMDALLFFAFDWTYHGVFPFLHVDIASCLLNNFIGR